MTLIIDNYDSFTYNLSQAIESLGVETRVVRNDKIDVSGIEALGPDRLVISPGPGDPDSAGVSLAAVKAFAGRIPILGVCLGHQTIAQAFGGRIVPAKSLMHGKTSRVKHDGKGIFAGVPLNFEAMRYHSLAVERASLPDCLEVSAETADGEVMALRHREFPIESVQYHPESIGTPEGARQLRNFFGLATREEPPEETLAYHDFRGVLRGDYSERELAALLSVGRDAPVSPARLAGAARAMREAMATVDLGADDAVDLVGTGGDGFPTINISTTAAFVAAGAGARIAKHGKSPPPRSAARRMSSGSWGSTFRCRQTGCGTASCAPGWRSSSPSATIPACATRRMCAASSASRPSSTCSGRLPIRPEWCATRSASTTRSWCRSSPAPCATSAQSARWCSPGWTGWTRFRPAASRLSRS